MKKLLVLAMCGLITLNTVACGNNSKIIDQYDLLSKEEPITLTFWHYYAGAALETLTKNAKEFNETIGAQYGVTVEVISKPSIGDLEIELSESAQGVVYADEMPSMFLAYGDKILELQNLGVVSDMNSFFSEEDKEFLIEEFMEYGVINDEQAMLPVVKSTEVLYLNDTNFQKFTDVTKYSYEDLLTWEGLIEVAKSYYEYTDAMTPDIKNDGKAFFGMDSINNFITVSSVQKGVDMFDAENGKSNIDETILKEIFDYYMEAYALGYMDRIAKHGTDDIRSGDLLALIGSSAGFVYMPDWIETDGEKEEIEWKASEYPYFEDATPRVVSQGAGIGVSNISQQQQQASALFLNYFWKDNITFAIESAYVPVTKVFLEMDQETKNAMYDEYKINDKEIEVYEIVSNQIRDGLLYQSAPFEGSYIVRTEIGYLFEEFANKLRLKADEMIKDGTNRLDAINHLDLDGEFIEFMSKLNITLENKGVDQ